MYTFEEFVEYYESTNFFPNGIYTPKKECNEKQLQSYYKKYCKKYEKIGERIQQESDKGSKDSLSEETKFIVTNRDGNRCRLWSILTSDEKNIAIKNGYNNPIAKKLTFAHVIRRSNNTELVNDPDNVYQVSLLFHSRLDEYKNPLTGKYLSKDDINLWWKRIVDDYTVYKYLTGENK